MHYAGPAVCYCKAAYTGVDGCKEHTGTTLSSNRIVAVLSGGPCSIAARHALVSVPRKRHFRACVL